MGRTSNLSLRSFWPRGTGRYVGAMVHKVSSEIHITDIDVVTVDKFLQMMPTKCFISSCVKPVIEVTVSGSVIVCS